MDSRQIIVDPKPLDTVITRPVTQYDRGVDIILTGDDVHYDSQSVIHLTRSGMESAISYPIVPQEDGSGRVYVADSWWTDDTPVTGYIVHVFDASDRVTEAIIKIPIRSRTEEDALHDEDMAEAQTILQSIRESEVKARESAAAAEHYAEILEQAQSVLPTVTVTRTLADDGAVFVVTDTAGNRTETELHDGSQGPQGDKGKDGTDGKDGVSPTVTTRQTETGAEITITDTSGQHVVTLQNGADGTDGKDGKDGQDGTNGTNGKDGKDGTSPTVSTRQTATGAEITITDGTGPHVVMLLNGKDGKDGEDGVTPVRGTDYWTAADKAEIVADVLAEIPVLEEVGV